MDYFGPVVNRSARVSDSAHGGQIVCTTEVYDAWNALDSVSDAMDTVDRAILQDLKLIDVGKHHYKGIQEEVQVYQVTNSLLRDRSFPPLRTEKAEEAEEEADETSS
jgi:class 3 adenylate cyclase